MSGVRNRDSGAIQELENVRARKQQSSTAKEQEVRVALKWKGIRKHSFAVRGKSRAGQPRRRSRKRGANNISSKKGPILAMKKNQGSLETRQQERPLVRRKKIRRKGCHSRRSGCRGAASHERRSLDRSERLRDARDSIVRKKERKAPSRTARAAATSAKRPPPPCKKDSPVKKAGERR